MSITLNGTTQSLSSVNSLITTYPFTLWARFNPTATGVAYYIFDISNDTAPVLNAYKLRAAGDSANNVRITVGDGSTSNATSTSTTFSAATWQTATYVGTSATSRNVFLNNGGVGAGSTNLTATGISKTYIGATNLNTVLSGFFSGSLSHLFQWNVALVAAQLAQLESSLNPWDVARANIVSGLEFNDTNSNVADLVKANTWTALNTPTYGVSLGIKRYRKSAC